MIFTSSIDPLATRIGRVHGFAPFVRRNGQEIPLTIFGLTHVVEVEDEIASKVIKLANTVCSISGILFGDLSAMHNEAEGVIARKVIVYIARKTIRGATNKIIGPAIGISESAPSYIFNRAFDYPHAVRVRELIRIVAPELSVIAEREAKTWTSRT